jgi:hypothetical protein
MKSPSSALIVSNSLLWLAFFGLFLLTTATTQAKVNTYAQIVRLSYLQGDVRLSRGNGKGPDLTKPWEQAVASLPILQGYSVATGNGRAEIEFEYGSTLYLAENSVLLFQTLTVADGVPSTVMELAAGTATVSAHPIPKEVFHLITPTMGFLFTEPSLSRVDSYLDGDTIALWGDGWEDVTQWHLGSVTYHGHGAPAKVVRVDHSGTPADWDEWVAARVKQRQADTVAALKASGLTSFVPGLTDLYNDGRFFSCAPFGTCWEPKELPETDPTFGAAQPLVAAVSTDAAAASSQLASTHATPQQTGPQQSGTTQSQTQQQETTPTPGTTPPITRRKLEFSDFSYVLAWCPLEFRDIETAIDPVTKKQTIVRVTDEIYSGRRWTWALCHSGAWIHRQGGYTFVVGKKRHHPPVHWLRTGNGVAYVPRHPSDVKGQPPLNLKYGVFAAKNGPNGPFEHFDFKPMEKYKVLSEAPKEFRNIQHPQLAKADRPEIQGRLVAGVIPGLPGKSYASPITYDYKTRKFVQAGAPVAGRTGKPVVLGSLSAHGGYSIGSGRSAGGGGGTTGGGGMHSGGTSGRDGGSLNPSPPTQAGPPANSGVKH